jgi:tetratricopeptide (TPR) repeat protein
MGRKPRVKKREKMKKKLLGFSIIILTFFGCATAPKTAPSEYPVITAMFGTVNGLVQAAVADLKTHTDLSLLDGHIAINISSGNKELDETFAKALDDDFPNFVSGADTVNHEDLYQMTIKVYRKNDDVMVRTAVLNFEQKPIVERTVTAQNVQAAIVDTLQYETAIHAKNEYETYLDNIFSDTDTVAAEAQSIRDILNRGIGFLNAEDYDSALMEFNKVLGVQYDNAEAFYYAGDAYYFKEEYWAAIRYYGQAIDINPVPISNPDYDDAYLARGLCYLELENYEYAIADFNKSEKLRPKNAYVFINRGFAYYMIDEYAKAVNEYTQYIKFNPKEAFPYYARAMSNAERKYTTSAINDCKKALEIDPNFQDARNLLASLQPPPKPPKPPKPPIDWAKYLPEIDKSNQLSMFFSVGLVQNKDETELTLPNIGLNAAFVVGCGYWGYTFSADLLTFLSFGDVDFDAMSMISMITFGIPFKMSGFIVKPYAGIGFDLSSLTQKNFSIDFIDKDVSFGIDYELGLQGYVGSFFLSAAYRQRIKAGIIEYTTGDSRSGSYYTNTYTDELFFKRFVISVGVDIF